MAWIREIEKAAAGGPMAELYAELRRQRELLAVAALRDAGLADEDILLASLVVAYSS